MGSSPSALIALILSTAPAWADCAPGRVELGGPAGSVAAFGIEIADTPALREMGLMNRDALPAGAGMLFVYDRPGHPRFWMKNTLIPLDMIFADAAGRITRIRHDAQPLDLTPVDGGEGVVYVLEINGGLAARLGIAPGLAMRAAAMQQDLLAWPCP